MVQSPNAPVAVPAGLDIPLADWQQTPPSVQTLIVTLLQCLEAVEARLKQDSTTSQRPPSTDSPYKKARKPAGDAPSRKVGGNPAMLAIGNRSWLQPRPGSSHHHNALVAVKP